MDDVKAAALEFRAERGRTITIEVLLQRDLDDRHASFLEPLEICMRTRADNRQFDPGIVHADERGDRREIGTFGNTQ